MGRTGVAVGESSLEMKEREACGGDWVGVEEITRACCGGALNDTGFILVQATSPTSSLSRR